MKNIAKSIFIVLTFFIYGNCFGQHKVLRESLGLVNETTTDVLNNHAENVDTLFDICDSLRHVTGSGVVYPSIRIPFGDGVTPGGITSADGPRWYISPDDEFTVGNTVESYIDIWGGGLSAFLFCDPLNNNIGLSVYGSQDWWKIENHDNAGIYYAGSSYTGFSLGSVKGLGIDIKNDVYSFGNPVLNFLKISTSLTNLQTNGSNILIQALNANLDLTSSGVTTIGTLAGTIAIDNITGLYTLNTPVINIGSKNIDYSAANSEGFWHNNGSGLIDYVPTGLDTTITVGGVDLVFVKGLLTEVH